MAEIVIGIDEAGTGSWAGIATITAVALFGTDEAALWELGVRDSKKLSDAKRRALVEGIADYAIAVHTAYLSAEDLSNDHEGTWGQGCFDVAKAVLESCRTKNTHVVVDGKTRTSMTSRWRNDPATRNTPLYFAVKADVHFAAVAAASIIAKTVRNDYMIALEKKYPQYSFSQHSGYGTDQHAYEIFVHGVTKEHRRVGPLKEIFKTQRWEPL